MPDWKLIGHNYQTPDIVAKVTGRSKYAEDFRAEGMLFCKLLLSPEPHARVRHIDARAALRMSGVAGILTADDLPIVKPDPDPTGAAESEDGERALTNEPLFEGEPILAVAAVDETTAAEAIEKINIDFERLPFVIDPIDSLRPGGPDARTMGNVFTVGGGMTRLKWTPQDLQEVALGRIPWNARAGQETSVGDVEAGLRQADSRFGRDAVPAVDTAPDTRVAVGDGVLAERKALPPWPRKASPRRFHSSRVGSASTRHTSSSSPNTAGAASAAKRPAQTAWLSRPCFQERPDGR